MVTYAWLTLLGVALGALGTLIGAGGGFVLVPVLLLLYPHEPPDIITSISLAVVFFNAASGSIAYARMGRIDYRSAALFSLAALPGAVLGALTTSRLSRRMFDLVLGAAMLAGSLYLMLSTPVAAHGAAADESAADADPATGANDSRGEPLRPIEAPNPSEGAPLTPARSLGGSGSKLAALRGRSRTPLGMAISVGVGYVSSLLGIGGGIVHVPLMVRVLDFPVHVATATSHMILAVMALAGTLVHVESGAFSHGYRRTAALAIGVVVGAQLGARFSNHVRGQWIIQALAAALFLVGLRVLYQAASFDPRQPA